MSAVLNPATVQGAVMCGVWWSLLDVLGNYAGQDHAACWVPIIRPSYILCMFGATPEVLGETGLMIPIIFS